MTKSVSIIQINDTHANLFEHGDVRYSPSGFTVEKVGGYARIMTKINEYKARYAEEVLIFDNGDTLHGTYEAIETKGEVMVPYLKMLGVDAMTFHWDAAYTIPHLKSFEQKLGYPILAANVYDEDTNDLIFPATAIFEVYDLTVGVIGLASNIIRSNMPESFWRGALFMDGIEEAKKHAARLKDHGVDLILLLSHLGYPQDIELLTQVPGIDLCLSGHTHNRIRTPQKIHDALIIQSGALASSIGFIRLTLDKGKVSEVEHEYVLLDETVEEDDKMKEALAADPTLKKHAAFLAEVVGETKLDLHRGSSFYGTMDYFLLDAMRDVTGAAIAFSNGWRYGGAIEKGVLTRRDLYQIVPMNPVLQMVELTGNQIWKLLEDNLESTFSTSPFKQMGGYIKRNAGLKVYFKLENPYGQRIQQIFVGENELTPDEIYDVVFVTEQAVPKDVGSNRRELSIRAIEVMKRYLEKTAYDRDDFESYIPV